ncbi:MAG: hypothetical protein KAR42_12730 [candidate division Zixibacteria bacterium]|nr:hypothetical protein [candidate division Zixibacteria bacterium]
MNKSNQTLAAIIITLSLLVFMSDTSYAKFGFNFGTSTTSSDNMFNDSNKVYDIFSTTSASVDIYPLTSLKISFSGEQTYYRETIGLGNVMGDLSLTFIPTKPQSKLSLYFSGSINGRTYHNEFSSIDNNYGQLSGVIGYQLRPNLNIRGGVDYKATVYVNSDDDYKRDLDFFAGANYSFLGNNVLDMEFGYSMTNYTYKDRNLDSVQHWDNPDVYIPADILWLFRIPDTKENLQLLFMSYRLSRTIGSKTGLNVTYTSRIYQNYKGGFLWGASTGFLSPWTAVWDGQTVSFNLKSYIIPKLIIKTGIGYWDKSYLITSDKYDGSDTRTYADAKSEDFARNDFVTKIYFGLQWPIAFSSGFFMEPTLNIEYTKNRSNKPLYYFDNFSITAGVSFRF